MRKFTVALLSAVALSLLVAAPLSAQTDDGAVVLPDENGECPVGFTLGYDDDIGDVCTEDIVRDFPDADEGDDITAAGTLPRTGSDSLPMTQIGVVLVVLGALAVLTARKRADVVAPRS